MNDIIGANPLAVLIGACELGFWILLGGGLVTRYVLRLRRASTVLLLAVPLLDLVLVTATVTDAARGTPPGAVHGLAGVYLGFTVAFGHATIRWADAWFAHRFAGGPRPPRAARYGPARVRREWVDWGRLVLALAVSLPVLLVTSLAAGRGAPSPTTWAGDPLWGTALAVAKVAVIWGILGPLWVTVRPPREPRRAGGRPAEEPVTTAACLRGAPHEH